MFKSITFRNKIKIPHFSWKTGRPANTGVSSSIIRLLGTAALCRWSLEVPHHPLQPDSFYAWPWWAFEFATPALPAPCPEYTSHSSSSFQSRLLSWSGPLLLDYYTFLGMHLLPTLISGNGGCARFHLSLGPNCINSLRVDPVSSTAPPHLVGEG